jgi:transcription initiation factor TFIID TATA-box-binding protein
MIDAEMVNLVATFTLYNNLNVELMGRTLNNCAHNPQRFSAAIVRRTLPVTFTCLCFSTGKCVLTGTRSLIHAHLCLQEFLAELQHNNIIKKANVRDFNVRNLTYRLSQSPFRRTPVYLDRLATMMRSDNHFTPLYEPEFFPGLHLKSREERTCILLFTTGKAVITGLKEESRLQYYLTHIERIANDYYNEQALER